MNKNWFIKSYVDLGIGPPWVDLGIVIPSEVTQTEKNKYHRYSLYVVSKKGYKWTYLQNRVTDAENKHGYRGVKKGRDKLGDLYCCIYTTT